MRNEVTPDPIAPEQGGAPGGRGRRRGHGVGILARTGLFALLFGAALAVLAVAPASSEDVIEQGDAGHGEELYQYACLACHGPGGQAQGRAMPLTTTLERFEPNEVVEIIRDGRGRMPAFENRFEDEEFADLVAYIATFDEDAPFERAGHTPRDVADDPEPDTVSGDRPGMWTIAALGLGPLGLIIAIGVVVTRVAGRGDEDDGDDREATTSIPSSGDD